MNRSHILVIEDEADAREPLKLLLEMEGFHVSVAENGAEALRKLDQSGPPCLIFLDLMMPVMNGWEFLQALQARRSELLAATPIVVTSAAADVETGRLAERCRILRKPFEIEQLIALARQHCRAV